MPKPSREKLNPVVRLGVDSGGTFTDCVLLEGPRVRVLKVFSTPDDPARGIVAGIRHLVQDVPSASEPASGRGFGRYGSPETRVPSAKLQIPEIKFQIEVVHGTTVGTNTLLERKGARVALITSAGFEDLIEIGRQNRPRLYDLGVSREPALVPRALRFGVRERTAADARVLVAPTKAEIRRLVAQVRNSGAESLALCFLFSYANPSNERIFARALATLKLPLSVSSQILPEFREYERASTVVVNAYLAPRLGSYLARLARAFEARPPCPIADQSSGWIPDFAGMTNEGFGVSPSHGGAPAETGVQGGPCGNGTASRNGRTSLGDKRPASARVYVMQSSGGITAAARAAQEPVRTILSGPAGGVVAAAQLAERLGIRRAISFDMGGTSTDVSLMDGAPRTTRETAIGGLPVAVPVLDVHSVGAGGGSLARIDAGGALRVGPESAGAAPGPVCYGRGGGLPTVTDAHLILGRLDPEHFLGGAFRLELRAAEEAFRRFLQPEKRRSSIGVGLRTPLDLARGIVAVANATMERALRVVSVERGHDPRDFALICFGGAGGLHAADLARALDLSQVIVPANPGAFSALGVLLSDVVKEVSRSVLISVPPLWAGAAAARKAWKRFMNDIGQRFARLERSARAEFRQEGFEGKIVVGRTLELRYAGQSYELTVPFGPAFRDAFHREHERAYGHSQPDRAIEIVNLRVRLAIRTPKPGIALATPQSGSRQPARASVLNRKPVWFGKEVMDTAFYDRSQLEPGVEFEGPAVVLEYSATTVVPPDFRGRVDGEGNLVLETQRVQNR